MRAFSRKNSLSGLRIRAEIDAREAAVLRSLVQSVTDLLHERVDSAPEDELSALTGIRVGNSAPPPEDSALARLLPDFQRADESSTKAAKRTASANSALRSLHEPDIIDAKIAAGQAILATLPEGGGRITLTADQADAWLHGINDIRLALGTTIGVSAELPDRLPPEDPRAPHLDVYHWLTWMQDSLLQAVKP